MDARDRAERDAPARPSEPVSGVRRGTRLIAVPVALGRAVTGEPLRAEVRKHLVSRPAEDLRSKQLADDRPERDAAVGNGLVVARYGRYRSHRGESVGWDGPVGYPCLCDAGVMELGNDVPRRFVEQPCEFRRIFACVDECVDLAAVEDHRSVSVGTDLDVRRMHGPVHGDLSTADPGDEAGFPAHRQVPCDEPGDVGGVGARCVHDDVDVEAGPIGQSDCPDAPVGTGADVTDRGAGPVLGAGCNSLPDHAADEMTSVHPGFVGVEHDWNLVGHRESRFEAAAHLGPRAHLDRVLPAGQQSSRFQEPRLSCGIVCPAQVAAGIPP